MTRIHCTMPAFFKLFFLSAIFQVGIVIGQNDSITSVPELNRFEATEQNETLSLEEFLGMIKAYHPYVKQAKINLSAVEADLLASRGVFDPKMSVKVA